MSTQHVSITTTDSQVRVRSPYNTWFAPAARKLGGNWVEPDWVFDRRDEDRVRALCLQLYGTDGFRSDLCTVRVTYDADERELQGPLTVNGRIVAQARGRDSGARLGEGVVLLSGSFTSGGSMKNWTTRAGSGGAVVLVRDFPRAAAEALAGSDVTIEPEAPLIDREALAAERERLVARLAEIDALLTTVSA